MSENTEPKPPTPEQLKRILDLRERIKRKEFERDIVEHFPKSAFTEHYKLSCGHWTSFSCSSSMMDGGTAICFRCVEDAEVDTTR